MSVVILLAGCGGLTEPTYTPATLSDESLTTESSTTDILTNTDIPTTTDSGNIPTDLIGATPPPSVTCTINGTDTDDELYGTPGDDVICAGDGNDVIYADTGNDIIYGGYGIDSIYAGDDDPFHPEHNGSGPDNDIIYGGPNTDEINGEQGNDIIYGHHGFDSLDGGPGDDVLVPGFEPGETVTGGNGSDVAVMINGQYNGWIPGLEPSSVPVPVSPPKLPIGFSIPLNSTDPKDMMSASVFKERVGITTSGDVCICDPEDQTL